MILSLLYQFILHPTQYQTDTKLDDFFDCCSGFKSTRRKTPSTSAILTSHQSANFLIPAVHVNRFQSNRSNSPIINKTILTTVIFQYVNLKITKNIYHSTIVILYRSHEMNYTHIWIVIVLHSLELLSASFLLKGFS